MQVGAQRNCLIRSFLAENPAGTLHWHCAAKLRDALLGRQKELSETRRAFAAAVEGAGGMIVLAGEPGIGKTRTIHEFLASVQDECTVLPTVPEAVPLPHAQERFRGIRFRAAMR